MDTTEKLREALQDLDESIKREQQQRRMSEALLFEIADLKQAQEKKKHLNLVLRTVRNVNRLITQKKDRDQLLKGACEILTRDRGYFNAWIALLDENKRATATFESGLGASFEPLAERLKRGKPTPCAKAALDRGEALADDPAAECGDCSLASQSSKRAGVSVRLEHGDRVYGVLTVSVPKEFAQEAEERSLLREVAGDIAFALHNLEVEDDRRRAEEALRASEEKYRFLAENVADVIWTMDFEGNLTYVSPSIEQLHGYRAEELLGRPLTTLMPPESEIKTRKLVEESLADPQGVRNISLEARHKDGRLIPIEVRAGFVRDDQGRPCGIIGTTRDITEKRNLQASLAQSDRLASMGMLAAGVAHEINNPLAYVLYNLESLTDDLPKLLDAMRQYLISIEEHLGEAKLSEIVGPATELFNPTMLTDVQERFKDALSGSWRIRDTVRGLGTFSRVEKDRLVPVNPMHIIEVAINMAFNEIKYRARLVKDYGKTPTLMASEGRLSQVFLNLLINAAHAIDEGDVENNEIRIRTWTQAKEICVEVRDTGKGIEPGHIQHIFEPFFTTKEVGVGSGLGLAISKDIIEGYGGRIEVQSKPDQGTSFVVRLPVGQEKYPAEVVAVGKRDVGPEVRGRILVIDDEPGIRASMKRTLRNHEVIAADSGMQGQQILEKDQAFDLILCDMMMPKMSGVDLHEWLTETHPPLAKLVVFITGGAFTPRTRKYLSKIDNLLIEKPFDVTNFKKMVSKLILAYRAKR
jgi:PAS domain S-box-containing protein